MNKRSKPVIEVKPVTWVNGDIPQKYQASVSLVRPNGEKKILVGHPLTTEKGAMNSLINEVMQRRNDIDSIIDVMEENGLIVDH